MNPPLQRSVIDGPPAQASAIPKVIGLLAIVFASLGLLVAVVLPLGFEDELPHLGLTTDMLGTFWTWNLIAVPLSAALFGVHLAGGLLAVRHSPRAPFLLTTYAVLALALTMADLAVSYFTFPSALSSELFDEVAGGRIGLALASIPWPIVVLALINQPSARRSCQRR